MEDDGRQARHSRGHDAVAAWGLVVSLVLGVVAAAMSLAGYLVDLPAWLGAVCLGAVVLGGVAAGAFAARQARFEHRSAARIVWETATAPVRFVFDVLF